MGIVYLTHTTPEVARFINVCYVVVRHLASMGSGIASKRLGKVDKRQHERFIKAARGAGVSDDEREFDENLKQIAKAKPHSEKQCKDR